MNTEKWPWPGIAGVLPVAAESHYLPHFHRAWREKFNDLVKDVHPLQILKHPVALEGGRAYWEGRLFNENPYEAETPPADNLIHWQNGYMAAKLIFGPRMSYYQWKSEHGIVLVYAEDERAAVDIACKTLNEAGHPKRQELRLYIFANQPKVVKVGAFGKVL